MKLIIKLALIASMFIGAALTAKAQNHELSLMLRGGDCSTFGGAAAASIETSHTFNRFSLTGGAQYNTIGKTALEARPSMKWGNISAELLMAYTNIASVNSVAAGAGAIYDYGRITAKLGYYYRIYGGHGNRISEPFNIYYELDVHLLRKAAKWDMDLTLTNNETFELERHYQPSFIAECRHCPTSKMGITFAIGCKPAGMFNLSADYYQSFIKTGICFRW